MVEIYYLTKQAETYAEKEERRQRHKAGDYTPPETQIADEMVRTLHSYTKMVDIRIIAAFTAVDFAGAGTGTCAVAITVAITGASAVAMAGTGTMAITVAGAIVVIVHKDSPQRQ